MHKSIYILTDLEGSSGCWSKRDIKDKSIEWGNACYDLSLDLNAVVTALFNEGVEKIVIKDFHGNGFNIYKELVDKRAELKSGYKRNPIYLVGEPPTGATAFMMIGGHAPCGVPGFLSHTFSSLYKNINFHGRTLSEFEIFAAIFGTFGVVPIFFSGCEDACRYIKQNIPKTTVYSVNKKAKKMEFNKFAFRAGLAKRAVEALYNTQATPFVLEEPYNCSVQVRGEKKEVQELAQRWNLPWEGNTIFIAETDLFALYNILINLPYGRPWLNNALWDLALWLMNFKAKRQLAKMFAKLSD